jgi:predicted alpha/beta superfamily hydrolase
MKKPANAPQAQVFEQFHYHHFDIPGIGAVHRPVRVYLPPSYASGQRHYPVVYMHDGQNLFDPNHAYARPWLIGKMIDRMPIRKQAIIVGIDNGREHRLDEYAPFKNKHHGGKGDAYAHFIVHTLKPFIDAHYRTLLASSQTWMVGSSMGGLITYYCALRYPHIFGKIGILSPAFWFNPQILQEHFTGDPADVRWYIAGSAQESPFMKKVLEQTYEALRHRGVPDVHLKVIIRDRGRHNEVFWSREFKKMYMEWMA